VTNQSICAVVFPGQGSQRPGMGRDFFDQMPESRRTYEEAADALGWDVAAVCFAEDERLNLTEYTQPCLVTTEIAMLRGLSARYGFSPSLFGGHSLGEFTALVAAGALSFAACLPIVQTRGRLMQGAVPAGVGAMTAVIADDLSPETIAGFIGELCVDIANINSSRQVVLSGEAGAIAAAEARLRDVLSSPSLRSVSQPSPGADRGSLQRGPQGIGSRTRFRLGPQCNVELPGRLSHRQPRRDHGEPGPPDKSYRAVEREHGQSRLPSRDCLGDRTGAPPPGFFPDYWRTLCLHNKRTFSRKGIHRCRVSACGRDTKRQQGAI
jgi:hypothetical protein